MLVHTRKTFFLVAALVATTAVAQNVAINVDFDTDLEGWSTDNDASEVSVQWNGLDADGAPGSGSAEVSNITPGPNNGVTLEQCVPATEGQTYSYGGRMRIPAPGLGPDDIAVIDAYWTSDAACLINLGLEESGFTPVGLDTWVTQPPSQIVAPSGTNGVKIRARVTKSGAGGALTVLFDDVYLGPGTFPVTLQSFSVE